MARMLRPDFATASVGLVGRAQHDNLARLHDWLVDELGMGAEEQVLATTNYQQGSFGRLPNHVLLVTNRRIAYTHDGGVRSIPLADLDSSRVGIKAGLVQGELRLQTRSGEALQFKKGVSLAIQEVAQLVVQGAQGLSAPPPVAPAPVAPAPVAPPPPAPSPEGNGSGSSQVAGFGDQVLHLSLDGYAPLRMEHAGSENFVVWELTHDGYQGDLLANTIGRYSGTRLCGLQGGLAGLEVNASGRWTVELLDGARLRPLRGRVTGHGDDVLVLPEPSRGLAIATFAHSGHENFVVWAHGAGDDLLVNDLGPYRGQVRIPPGTELVALQADGPWEVVLD